MPPDDLQRRAAGAVWAASGHHVARQLADILREQIKSGALAPRTALPSILDLAHEHGISSSTVQKALRILKDEGLVTSVPGYGTFVAQR